MSAQLKEQICMLQLEGIILSSRFEVQYRLRCGSYSELFLARNISPRDGEPETVVIKALNVRLQGEPTDELKQLLIEGVEREAAALKQCGHENIVRLFDCGAALDQTGREFYFLVLEYLAGGSLKDLLQSRRLNLQESLSLLGQVKDALSCIHQCGLVHRDIKPSNVMLWKDHRLAKLIDLGTIRWLDDTGQITEIGTPTYAAPEHYSLARTKGKSLTVAADVYAFAKTSYTVLTGQVPTSFKQLQITRLPRTVQVEAWAIPVLRVLMKATSDNPAERHQSVADFFADLSDATEVTTYTTQSRGVEEAECHTAKSRFVVDVTPPTKEPSRMTIVLAEFSTLINLVLPVVRNLCLRIVGCCLRTFGIAGGVPGKLYAVVAAIVFVTVSTLVFGPELMRLARKFTLRPPIVEQKRQPVVERLKATTDINIRKAPGRTERKIGLVESDSIVRMLNTNQTQKWCEIEIETHGRPKMEPGLDRGWVACQYLAAAQ